MRNLPPAAVLKVCLRSAVLGRHQPVESCRVDRCYVIHKYGGNPVFRANHAGEALIRNVRFSDIFIEGNVGSLVGLKIMNHRYDPDLGHNSIEDVYFKNITAEGQPTNNFRYGESPSRIYASAEKSS